MRLSAAGFAHQQQEGERRCLNSELWHACAGPLVSLPAAGSRVVYFPQGHSEQVTASTNREVDAQIPNYPSLPPQLICQLHNLTMHADVETDEVYAQMTLQPLSLQEQKDPYLPADMGVPSKQPTNYFCKTLTASDTSTHGGFSVPRRAAEKVFPPLDFSQKPPVQELIARDLHDNEWKFRHIFRGQPKRHLLTTGWSVFVSAKRLVAGDSVLFIWNENKQLLLGIRRANRPQTVMPSSVLSSDSMHLGLLAAAAHAAATNSHFTIFYNPRASPSEFVIPLVKYVKAVCQTQVSVGMRFRMLFETEELSVRRYMGTVTGIGDFDPSRWSNSHWRSVKVGWDESTAGERQPKVSLWEIEPLMTFPMYPPPFSLRLKRPWPTGFPSIQGMKGDDLEMKPPLMRLHGDNGGRGIPSLNFQGVGVTPWLQTDGYMLGLQTDIYQAMATSALQEMRANDPSKQATPLVRFQQPQNLPGRSACILQPKMLQQQPQPQSTFLQGIQENHHQVQSLSQPESHILQPALQNQHSISTNSSINNSYSNSNNNNGNNNQQQTTGLAQPQQQEQLVDHPQVSSLVSSLSQFTSASPSHSLSLQMMPSLCYQQSFSDLNGISVTSPIISPLHSLLGSFPQDDPSHLFNLPQTNPLINSSVSGVVEPLLPSGTTQCVLPPMEQLVPPQTNISQNSISLPPFPSRECSIDVEGSADPQGHLLFGVSIEPTSLLMQDGISGLRGICTENNSPPMSIPSSNFMSTVRSNFQLNPVMTPSNYIDETGFLQSPENMGQVNTQTRNFVKVHKLGSFGRSLDITKFSSYHELRGELARMFGLEGQLEDPLRSGWQLVFVDQENDVLLLGDGPWPEFVNSVWCIKILSPPEVQQMGGRQDLLNSVPIQKLSNSR